MENTANGLDLSLTDSAIAQVKNSWRATSATEDGLRVGVSDGGCSGFSYKLDFDNQTKPDDVVLELRRRQSLRRRR